MMFQDITGVSKHAQERFLLRFGFVPTAAEWRAAVLAICDRRALLLTAQLPGPGREAWRVEIAGVACNVVWGYLGIACIITVLPPDARFRSPPRRTVPPTLFSSEMPA